MIRPTATTTGTFALVFLFILSCQQKSNPAQDDILSDSIAFRPNPIVISEQEVTTLAIGAKAPDFSLPDVSGKFYSLSDFKQAEVLVAIFTCNHCPTAQAYEDRIIQFTKDYIQKNVQVVAIMPNSVLGIVPEEGGYTDLNDSYQEMIIRAKDKGFNFPYLYDGDSQSVALKYGPTATPHVFVFDRNRLLQYQGRIDNSEKPGTGHAEDLRNAVDDLLANKKLRTPQTKTFGCSVKWGWKNEYTQVAQEQWDNRTVTLEPLNVDGIRNLAKNEKGKKLRLINVWATWCGPCVAEFPEMISLQRMYGGRDFELISVSADELKNQEKALAFLQKKHAAIPNYIFKGKDKYELIEAIDPQWNGALPYTLLIEPEGKVVYRYQGPVEFLHLKRAIVDHPLIGRYY